MFLVPVWMGDANRGRSSSCPGAPGARRQPAFPGRPIDPRGCGMCQSWICANPRFQPPSPGGRSLHVLPGGGGWRGTAMAVADAVEAGSHHQAVVRGCGDASRPPDLGEGRARPIGLHGCRHTFASLMIATGVNAKALSTHIGHASISITMDRYGHPMPGNEAEAAERLGAYLISAAGSALERLRNCRNPRFPGCRA